MRSSFVLPSALRLILVCSWFVCSFASAAIAESQVWHIKAVHPDGELLRVKAIDEEGNLHDIKAIEQSGNAYVLDIKAFVNGAVWSVKVLDESDWFGPVKAIGPEGQILAIKALTADDQRLDVKAVSRAGQILDIKAIGGEHQFYGIKAVAPNGRVYDVKGLKMSDEAVEGEVHGVSIRAHIKALPQVR